MNVRKMFLISFCFLVVWGFLPPFAHPQWNAEFFEDIEMILNYKIKYTSSDSFKYSSKALKCGQEDVNGEYRDDLEVIFEGTVKNYFSPFCSPLLKERDHYCYYLHHLQCTNSYNISISGGGNYSEIVKKYNCYCLPKEYIRNIEESNWTYTKKNVKEVEDRIRSYFCTLIPYPFIYKEITDKHPNLTYFFSFGDNLGYETSSGESIINLIRTVGQSKYERKTITDTGPGNCSDLVLHYQDNKDWEGSDPLFSNANAGWGIILDIVRESEFDIREIFKEKLRNNPTTLKRTGLKGSNRGLEFPYSYTQNGITCIGKDAEGVIDCGILGKYEENEKGFVSGSASFLREGEFKYRNGSRIGISRGTVEISYTLSLNPHSSYEVLIEPPKNLKDWLPKGGKDDNSPGDTLTFKGKVMHHGKGGREKDRRVKVTFDLDSSRVKGTCMNYPPKDRANNKPDLRIIANGTSKEFKIEDDGLKAEGDIKPGNSFTLAVGSFDYGGSGKITVSADSGAVVKIEGYPNTGNIQLPRDENNNLIADAWEKMSITRSMSSNWNSDEDRWPEGDGNRGDGLTLYEEYRGFMIEGKHKRLYPHKKDLFVFIENERWKAGLKLFEKASNLNVWRISKNEMGHDRVINFNYRNDAHIVDQHGLKVIEADLTLEQAAGLAASLGPPKHVKWIKIDKDYEKMYRKTPDETVAHELGHGVRMEHHGEGNYYCGEKPDACNFPGGNSGFYIAVQHGQNSGVEDCIMRYLWADYIEKDMGGGITDFIKFGLQSGGYIRGERSLFCDTGEGTGMNAPDALPFQNLGDAMHGDCIHQICISDFYH